MDQKYMKAILHSAMISTHRTIEAGDTALGNQAQYDGWGVGTPDQDTALVNSVGEPSTRTIRRVGARPIRTD